MKKLFHQLGIIAIFAITVTSCSKSSNDLVANEKTAAVEPSGMQIGNSNYGTILSNETEIFNFINQPIELELGVPERSFLNEGNGELAVFYVLVSPDFINEPMKIATFGTVDNSTGEVIRTYELINSTYADDYGVTVPERIKDRPSMFAVINLTEAFGEHANVPINLYSEIITEQGTLVSRFPAAFVYQQ